jgi:hypothetical protein
LRGFSSGGDACLTTSDFDVPRGPRSTPSR